jgi:hypothetical protein
MKYVSRRLAAKLWSIAFFGLMAFSMVCSVATAGVSSFPPASSDSQEAQSLNSRQPEPHSPRAISGHLSLDDLLIDREAPTIDPPIAAPSPATTPGNDSANAIPLPPAVQSGITAMLALGIAAMLRRFCRLLR